MSTIFCQKCHREHPGRVCDYDEKGECTETLVVAARNENTETETVTNPQTRSAYDGYSGEE